MIKLIKKYWLWILFGVILLIAKGKSMFTKPVTPYKVRGNDYYGSGAFGASRGGGTRKHKGIDICVNQGQAIFAPFDGIISKHSQAYPNDAKYKGLHVTGTGKFANYRVKILYMLPYLPVNAKVKAGDIIGYAQDIDKKYETGGHNMENHIHLEIYKDGSIVDPTPFFA